MKTETHYKYALALCDRYMKQASQAEKAAFVAGCVIPDVDMVSYLRGFRTRPFFGHNWENAKDYIMLLARACDQGKHGFYSQGLLVHYICDAFTFVHNSGFVGGLRQHTEYEKRLHTEVLRCAGRLNDGIDLKCESLANMIDRLHLQYMSRPQSLVNDARYISLMTEQAMSVMSLKCYRVQTPKITG